MKYLQKWIKFNETNFSINNASITYLSKHPEKEFTTKEDLFEVFGISAEDLEDILLFTIDKGLKCKISLYIRDHSHDKVGFSSQDHFVIEFESRKIDDDGSEAKDWYIKRGDVISDLELIEQKLEEYGLSIFYISNPEDNGDLDKKSFGVNLFVGKTNRISKWIKEYR
jgi:hypothetical protein